MIQRELTLTTVGLSVRDELRVKSLLQLVDGKTAARWSYVDELEVDLAICEPDSVLAQATIRQTARNGGPRWVALLRQGARLLPDTPCVYAPLSASDLISILDATQARDDVASRQTGSPAEPQPESGVGPGGNWLLAHTLHDIAENGANHAHRVDVGGVTLLLTPSHDRVLASEHLTPASIAALGRSTAGIDVQYLGESDGAAEAAYRRYSLKYLLWHVGSSGSTTALLPWLPRAARFRLTRWPDFGKVGHVSWQVRLSAQLIRNAHSLQHMAALVARPISEVRAYVNACGMCGILEHEPLDEADVPAPVANAGVSPPAKTSRWSGVMRSIRSALRIGDL